MPRYTIQKQKKWFGLMTILFLAMTLLYIGSNSMTSYSSLSNPCDCRRKTFNRAECLDVCETQFIATDSQATPNRNLGRNVVDASKHTNTFARSKHLLDSTAIPAVQTTQFSSTPTTALSRPHSFTPVSSTPASSTPSTSTPRTNTFGPSTLATSTPSASAHRSNIPGSSTTTSKTTSASIPASSTSSTSTTSSSTSSTSTTTAIPSTPMTAPTATKKPQQLTPSAKVQHSSVTIPASTTTSRPPGPVFIPNLGMCDACFSGKQLVSVDKGWLCSQPRIGNKMFMMASAIALADSWNATFVLPQGDKKCDWVERLQNIFVTVNTTIPLLPADLMVGWASVGEPGFTGYKPYDKTSKNVTLGGYRQSWKYFQTKSEQQALRDTFKFHEKYETAAIKNINAARNKYNAPNGLLVGVHMRIGDLLDKNRLDYGYVMANESFYQQAFQAAHNQLNQSHAVVFIVATDTKDKTKKMLSGLEKLYDIFWTEGDAYEDLATLTKCNHSIISGGTFGFWAAWLAGGDTFYFANFSRFNTSFQKGFNSENFYLPHWKPVSWHK